MYTYTFMFIYVHCLCIYYIHVLLRASLFLRTIHVFKWTSLLRVVMLQLRYVCFQTFLCRKLTSTGWTVSWFQVQDVSLRTSFLVFQEKNQLYSIQCCSFWTVCFRFKDLRQVQVHLWTGWRIVSLSEVCCFLGGHDSEAKLTRWSPIWTKFGKISAKSCRW